jgi:hypothetical protein
VFCFGMTCSSVLEEISFLRPKNEYVVLSIIMDQIHVEEANHIAGFTPAVNYWNYSLHFKS